MYKFMFVPLHIFRVRFLTVLEHGPCPIHVPVHTY